ncbi:mucin-5AC [Hermetia illucens]|uniref:mucin-5AC n=1 Tax=Hermetia illucens TaxID=343691 RepID=UPI0018CC6EC8|nr:mucin-5AC [Hermetia illucens]
MERSYSLGGHLSLSASNIASPLAESTQINGSILHSKFPWGGKMSPAKSSAGTSNGSILQKSVPKVASPMRKIDPRVYTDVQSKGLASRIVKYHENSSKLNRSMSVGNLYSKPGQFPVVHLKKAEVQVNPRRTPSLSTVRIAPPEKSLYQVSTRSSIFRTGSITPAVAGIGKLDERESRDNRPIVPPAENDVNPTRSVLDALKEISRKRINSDDVDCNDSIKKYCKESDEDSRHRLHLPLHNINSTSQQVSVITKRQREVPASPESKPSSPESAGQKKRPCTKNNDISSSLSSSLLINTPKRKLQDIQGRPPIGRGSPSSGNLAPPRAKQHCNDRNYVITSNSASEDLLNYPPDQLTPIPPTPAVESAPVQSKPKRPQPAPQKPKLTLFNKDYDTAEVIRRENKETREPEEEGIAGISFIKPKKHSPTLTGKNALIERVQSSKLSLMLSCLSGELNDSDDEVDSKVEELPKKATVAVAAVISSSSISTTNSSITSTGITSTVPTTSSSQPLIATSTSSSTTSASTSTASTATLTFGAKPVEPAASSASIPSAIASSDSTKVSESAPKPVFSFGNMTTTKPSETTTTTPAISAASSSSGFSLSTQPKPVFGSPQPSLGLTFSTSSTPAVVSKATSVATSTAPTPSGGFTFGQQNSAASKIVSAATFTSTGATAASTTATKITSTSSNTSLFSFGSSNPPQSNVAPTFTATSSPSVSFPASKTSESSSFTASVPAFGNPVSTQSQPRPLFSFGATPAITATTSSTSISSSVSSFGSTVSKPLPVFGSSTSTTSSTSPAVPAFGSQQQANPPSFGSLGSSAFSPAASGGKPPPKFGESGNTFGSSGALSSSNSGGFTFGGSQPPAPTATTGLFGAAAGNPVATTASNSTFSFGSSSTNKPSINFNSNSASNVAPAFGSVPTTTTAAPASQTSFAFGSTVANATQPATTQSTPFAFGGAAGHQPQAPSASFSFGGSAPAPNSSPFAFGSAAPTAQAQPQVTKSFSFGGGAAPSAFTTVNKPATGGFSFNASSATAPATKSLFGSTANEPVKPFAFSATATKSDPQPPPPAFGSPASQNTAAPAFGAPAMTPGKLFTFGGAPANNNVAAGAAPGTNLFGNSATNNSSSSLFPSAPNPNPPPFGAASAATAKPPGSLFTFGGGVNSNNTNPTANNTPFAFGSSAPQTESNKPFAFGAASQPVQQTGSIFGSSTVNKAAAFNFSATAGGTSAPDAMNNNNPLGVVANPFDPTSSGTDASSLPRREIRTATRRLKQK